ncbi:MAG: hypothetical protein KC543_10185 [Myxococcales bacterium]|nr:hypothetical protein [Myxococcales bacterium]
MSLGDETKAPQEELPVGVVEPGAAPTREPQGSFLGTVGWVVLTALLALVALWILARLPPMS